MKTIREVMSDKKYNTNKLGWKPLFGVKSKAKTLRGINAAIERYTGEKNWFEDLDALRDTEKEGFITYHSDGFIIWIDGD